jgi:hypothetical protein
MLLGKLAGQDDTCSLERADPQAPAVSAGISELADVDMKAVEVAEREHQWHNVHTNACSPL